VPIDKLSANAFATGAVANSLGYTPANKAGDTFSGAVSGITTLAAGNTTLTGTASVSQGLTSNTLTVSTNTVSIGTSLYGVANGNIGIGTASPGTKVAIVSNSSIQGLKITSTNDWGNISTPFVDIDGNANSTGDGNILRLRTGAARTDNKIFEIVNGSGTPFYVRGDGLQVINGVAEQIISISNMGGNSTYNYDITVGNEGGEGNIIEVHAFFDHFYNFSYGAGIVAIIGKRQNSIQQQNIYNYTSGNGGSWSFSAPNSTTLRITKNAGTYAGSGFGHILVRWKKFD